MDRVLLRSSHELGRSLAGEDLNSLESSALGPQKDHTDVREKHTADFFTAGAAWAIKPLRTDAVSRGQSISLFTQETISHSISIRLCLSSRGPLIERSENYHIEFGTDLSPAYRTKDPAVRARVCSAASLAPPPRIFPAPATEQTEHSQNHSDSSHVVASLGRRNRLALVMTASPLPCPAPPRMFHGGFGLD
jgi:hypothetical protein